MIVQGKIIPDFMIVGAAKSGSTAIYNYLKQSQNVFLPTIKEPHFFSLSHKKNIFGYDNLPERLKENSEYCYQFSRADKDQIIGEGSQSYLYCYEDTIAHIKQLYGNSYKKLKIIIILRNPIERAWSQYWHFKKNNNESLSFLQAIDSEVIKKRLTNNWNVFYDYIGFGMYLKQIKVYKENFNNVNIYLYDDFKSSNKEILKDISNFLDIPANFFDDSLKIHNISGKHKSNIYGFFWKLNLATSHFQSIKRIFPDSFRKNVSNALMNKALERQKMALKEREVLIEIYRGQIESLAEFLDNDKILQWLKN